MNPYKVLEIDVSATREEIKSSYHRLALKYHPDKNPGNKQESEQKFKEISEAYQILIDETTRQKYDIGETIDQDFMTANELFDSLFENTNPKIKNFIKTTYNNINNAIEKNNGNMTISDVLNSLDKKQLVSTSADLIAEYFFTKSSIEKEEITNKNGINNIYIEKSHLKTQNNLLINLETFFERSINLFLVDNNIETEYRLETAKQKHSIIYDDHKYIFNLLDKKHPTYKRLNTYDLTTTIEIGIDDYFNGFVLNLKCFSNIIQESVELVHSNTNILRLENKGLKIHRDNEYGDLYICFKIVNSSQRLHKHVDSYSSIRSSNIENLVSDISVYN